MVLIQKGGRIKARVEGLVDGINNPSTMSAVNYTDYYSYPDPGLDLLFYYERIIPTSYHDWQFLGFLGNNQTSYSGNFIHSYTLGTNVKHGGEGTFTLTKK